MSQFFAAALAAGMLGLAGPRTFTDPVGDAAGAPDVSSVTVASSGASVVFAVHVLSAESWDGGGAYLMVDSDANYATGHNDGVDFLYTLHRDHTFDAGRWNGKDNFDPYGSAATGVLSGDTLTIAVPLRELDSTRKLAFAVLTFGPGDGSDEAPDGSFAPGTPPRWEFEPTAVVAFSPAAPVHGRRFAVVAPGATCSATLAGAKLARGCTWRIPSGARGKRLRVVVSVAGSTRVYSFRVR
jgi:hypothetical protein